MTNMTQAGVVTGVTRLWLDRRTMTNMTQVGVVTGVTRLWLDRWTTTSMTQVGVVTGVCVDKVVAGHVDNDKYDTDGCSDRCYKVVVGQVDK